MAAKGFCFMCNRHAEGKALGFHLHLCFDCEEKKQDCEFENVVERMLHRWDKRDTKRALKQHEEKCLKTVGTPRLPF
jgi:hypothetical protein